MTGEEAAEMIKSDMRLHHDYLSGEYRKALKLAISALEQPEIIRCKDCLHWVRTCGDNHWGLGDCDVFDKHLVMCEGYCAWAERMEE